MVKDFNSFVCMICLFYLTSYKINILSKFIFVTVLIIFKSLKISFRSLTLEHFADLRFFFIHFSFLSSIRPVFVSVKIIMKLVALIAIALGCTLGASAQGPKVTDIVSKTQVKT